MNSYKIRKAKSDDLPSLASIDKHLNEDQLREKIRLGEVLVCEEGKNILGVLRFNRFWDLLPFINWMWVHEENRKKGIGSALIEELVGMVAENKEEVILTSTQSDEEAQHFYRKLGFEDIGGFVLEGEPMELILVKYLTSDT